MFLVIFMVITIILAITAILGMLICIFKYPSLRIKGFVIDTFYLPILLAAIILLIFPIFNKEELFSVLFSNSTLNPLKILVLFICVSILSIALDEAGFFNFIATIFINKFKASQYKLFIALYILISLLTVFTSNDIVILTFTPFILYFSKKGNINPIPYLVMEFVAANSYSMLLSIGNPTNIYLASAFNLSFIDYFIQMILPTLLCGIVSITTLLLMFKKYLIKPITVFEMGKAHLTNKVLCIICAIHLFTTTVLLAISNYINMEMWIICLSFAASLMIILLIYSIKKKSYRYIRGTLRRIPYSLIPFILSMFTIIMALDSYNVFEYINKFFSSISSNTLEAITYLVSSTLACNLVNNIPMTLAYGSILDGTNNLKLVYATIIGSNIGAILSPVGALAGIMWLRILKQNNINYSFMNFVKNGVILTSGLLLAGIVALLII